MSFRLFDLWAEAQDSYWHFCMQWASIALVMWQIERNMVCHPLTFSDDIKHWANGRPASR